MTNCEFFNHITTYFRSGTKAELWCDNNGCELSEIDIGSLQTYKDVAKVIVDINIKRKRTHNDNS